MGDSGRAVLRAGIVSNQSDGDVARVISLYPEGTLEFAAVDWDAPISLIGETHRTGSIIRNIQLYSAGNGRSQWTVTINRDGSITDSRPSSQVGCRSLKARVLQQLPVNSSVS